MKRIVLGLLSTVSAVVLLFGYHTSTSGPAGPTAAVLTPAIGSGSTTRSSSSTSGSTVTGDVAQTRWGPVQVQVTTDTSGRITDIEVVQYPSGNPKDQEINSVALPRLVSETMDAQSADIDMVTGATVTSEGYLQSLQSALDQASA